MLHLQRHKPHKKPTTPRGKNRTSLAKATYMRESIMSNLTLHVQNDTQHDVVHFYHFYSLDVYVKLRKHTLLPKSTMVLRN